MTSQRMSLRLAALALAATIAATAAQNQGVVTFNGLPVPGVSVTVSRGDQKFTTTTDESGAYAFPNLAEGAWKTEVAMTGFAKLSRDVEVKAESTSAAWELKLLPPPLKFTGFLLPSSPQASMTPAQRAAAIAAATRNQQAAAAAAAAANGGGGATGGGGGGIGDAFVMSGSLGGGSGATGQADSFGNSIKNGRAVYNGNLGFTLDNSVWDARAYSLNGQATPKPAFARGHINASFGGPLKIPHLLNGKGGMFTINYQAGRTRNGNTLAITVPSAFERTGDFSQSIVRVPVTVYDRSGLPLPGNRIPASLLDATAIKLAAYYPLPNSAGSRLNYQTPVVAVSDQDNVNARVNQKLGPKDQLSGSIGYQRSSTRNPNAFGFVDTGTNNGINANISWNHNFSKTFIAYIRYTFSRSQAGLTPYFAQRTNVAADLGILGTSSLPLNWGPPNLAFTNFTTLSDGNASLSRNQTSNLNGGAINTHGKHQFNYGGDFRKQQFNPLADANGRGTYAFTGLGTSAAGNGGYDFADFLMGRPDTANIRFGNADKYFRAWKLDGYALDNWQVTPALTLNLGVRYDYTPPFTELYDRFGNLSVTPDFSTIAAVRAGQAGLSRSIVKRDFNNFGPNIGVAWRPFPKRTKAPTVIRLGYGMSHPVDIYPAIANAMASQPPFAKTLSIASSPQNPLTLQNGFTANPAVSNTFAVDPNYRLPMVQQMMVMGQQMFPKRGIYVVMAYVGIKGTRLDQEFLPNSLPPGLTTPLGAPPSGYVYAQSSGYINGNIGTIQMGRQMASGFSASFGFTMASIIGTGGMIGSNSFAQNWRDLDAERSRMAIAPPRQVNATWQYSSGQGKAGGTMMKGWKGGLRKDWTITNTLSLKSGTPLTAMVGGNLATVGGTGITGTVRADATGLSVAAPAGSGQPFNLAAFAVPAAGQWGNAGRSTIPGPTVFGMNGSVSRVFRLDEHRSFDLRFDAANFLNHVTITSWNTVVNAYNYGLPTGAGAMRSLTANLRFRF